MSQDQWDSDWNDDLKKKMMICIQTLSKCSKMWQPVTSNMLLEYRLFILFVFAETLEEIQLSKTCAPVKSKYIWTWHNSFSYSLQCYCNKVIVRGKYRIVLIVIIMSFIITRNVLLLKASHPLLLLWESKSIIVSRYDFIIYSLYIFI